MKRHEALAAAGAAERFPDFFLIGAPKCGTTSLFSWLQQHPDTYLPTKEPNFFSRDILDTSAEAGAARTFEDYLDRVCPPEAAGRLTGEATPKYLYSETALEALARRAGRVRLLVLLRNPIDLAAAMHMQNLRTGREREPDFVRAWARWTDSPGNRLTDYRFWGQPGIWLERYLARFSRQDIKVLILEEEMASDPAVAHAMVLDFLGLPPQRLVSYENCNPSKTFRSASLHGASRRLRRDVLRGAGRLGLSLPKIGLLRYLDRINGARPGERRLAADLRAEMAAELAEDAQRTARLLGRSALPWPDFAWPISIRPDPGQPAAPPSSSVAEQSP